MEQKTVLQAWQELANETSEKMKLIRPYWEERNRALEEQMQKARECLEQLSQSYKTSIGRYDVVINSLRQSFKAAGISPDSPKIWKPSNLVETHGRNLLNLFHPYSNPSPAFEMKPNTMKTNS